MLREARSNRPSNRVALLCVLVGNAAACTNVSGGAVELSWKLRPASSDLTDKFVACNSGKEGAGTVTAIRLDWDVGGTRNSTQWPCDNNYGVTGFDLPPGTAVLSVVPICETDAASPDTYITPPPTERTVILGDTVSLGAVELVVVVSNCVGPMHQHCICS
jgi:hypothetical protein